MMHSVPSLHASVNLPLHHALLPSPAGHGTPRLAPFPPQNMLVALNSDIMHALAGGGASITEFDDYQPSDPEPAHRS